MAVPLLRIRRGLPFCFVACRPVQFYQTVLPVNDNDSHITFNGIPDALEFEKMFNRYYSRLCLFAYRLVYSKETAEDIVQDCFTSIWKRRAEIDWTVNIVPYLYNTARFQCYKFLRDNKQTAAVNDVDLASENVDPLLLLIEVETYHQLHQAIQQLPAKSGNIFKAIYLQGKEINEVSRDHHITPSTVRSHKAAAISFLRHKLGYSILIKLFYFLAGHIQ